LDQFIDAAALDTGELEKTIREKEIDILIDLNGFTEAQFAGMAIELSTTPTALAAIKDRLARNRLTMPLFNTSLYTRYTRHLESAYVTMYERYRKGLPPEHIYVPHVT